MLEREKSQEKMYNEASHHNEIDLDIIDINSEPPIEEPFRQYYFMAKCRRWVKDFEQKNGHLPKSCVTTFGCQMNTEVEIEKAA